jgi:hypothetical protein
LLLDAALVKLNVLDVLHFTVESWCCVAHIRAMNYYHECGFSLTQINDGEDAAELTIAKDD